MKRKRAAAATTTTATSYNYNNQHNQLQQQQKLLHPLSQTNPNIQQPSSQSMHMYKGKQKARPGLAEEFLGLGFPRKLFFLIIVRTNPGSKRDQKP